MYTRTRRSKRQLNLDSTNRGIHYCFILIHQTYEINFIKNYSIHYL